MFVNSNPYLYTMTQNFPGSPLFPTYQNPQSQPQAHTNSNIVWVQGEVGARSYQLAPNSSIILMDNDDSKFYIKTTDGSGMATLKAFKFEEIVKQTSDSTDYVSRQEFSEFKNGLEGLLSSLSLGKEKAVENNEPNLPAVKSTIEF